MVQHKDVMFIPLGLTAADPIPAIRPSDGVASAITWLRDRRMQSDLVVRRVDLARCDGWSLVGGELRHDSGRYFQLVAIRELEARTGSRTMIRQLEVGTLGFLVRERMGTVEWLVQAKTEPGNVRGTQLAPTVQATASNQDRVHGGASTRFLEWFRDTPSGKMRSDVLASEQGWRFLGKQNRNVVVTSDPTAEPADGGAWRWLDRATVRTLLGRDFTVNTDARSVIVTSPWSLLADDGTPFAAAAPLGSFGRLLRRSYEEPPCIDPILQGLLDRRADAATEFEQVPLTLDGAGAEGRAARRGAACVRVDVADREVPTWCQPLLESQVVERLDLHAQVRQDVLRFHFRYTKEPGLSHRVELGPTVQTDDGRTFRTTPAPGGVTRLRVLQSDEGGRFLSSVADYRIIELPEQANDTGRDPTYPDGVWLSLSEVEALARLPATFTNEARSLVSLLLTQA
jgi:dTDP-4-dehydro-6-deoxy-alpha-D-glucopyranose 2,3-dehydratase